MVDYRKLYMGLFVAVIDATEHLEEQNCGLALQRLITAQQDAEEGYLDGEEGLQDK